MTKTATFAVVHISVAFSVGYLMTGSALVGGAIALVEPAVNTVAYHLHEQVWKRWDHTRGASCTAPARCPDGLSPLSNSH
ncbi:MAG: DUF2061 domain-containing protein [Pseudomonadota bacterium]|nr:MAG: DUF2061 domain-containing protein [Pseudomonadota bacterium]